MSDEQHVHAELTYEEAVATMTEQQILTLAALIKEQGGKDDSHWHINDCGCCVTIHGRRDSWIVGADGESTYYPNQTCGCWSE